ncbi:hypothetical protein D3C75_1140600 [compost metagenome]
MEGMFSCSVLLSTGCTRSLSTRSVRRLMSTVSIRSAGESLPSRSRRSFSPSLANTTLTLIPVSFSNCWMMGLISSSCRLE